VLGLIGLAVAAFLWWLPASDFILVPDKAKPLSPRVTVENARPVGKGDVFYVDVFVRRMRALERLLPFTRPEGSTVVPEQVLLPPGTTQKQRDRENTLDMQRSEQIASVVALRALGYDVQAVPRGALVVDVFADAPAHGKLQADDVIVAVDGVPVRTPDDLRGEIGRRKAGQPVRLTVRRDGRTQDITVRTVRSPQRPYRPVVGITVDQDARIRLPVKIDIDLGDVGGPSAGLPFALEVVRKLGRNITHGCDVAATGELALDGTVESIGGVRQKTIGARRAGVDIFVVPKGRNATEARRYADGLRILPVDSFQQAFRELTTSAQKC
jgi:PDZ domain-containing protein